MPVIERRVNPYQQEPDAKEKEVPENDEVAEEGSFEVEEIAESSSNKSIEDIAAEKGHVSKDEWVARGNDPDEWIDAKEFVERGPLYERIHKQSRELKKMKETLKAAEEFYTKAAYKEKEKEIEDLKRKLEEASDNRDIKTALEVKDQIHELEQSVKQAVKQAEVPQEYYDWAEKNSWYDKDVNPDMWNYATKVGQALYNADPERNLSEIYNEVTEMTKRKFPNKFQSKQEETKKVTTVTTTSKRVTTNNTQGKKKLPSIKQLPEDARLNYKRLVKSDTNRNGLLSPEQFWANYDGPLLEE